MRCPFGFHACGIYSIDSPWLKRPRCRLLMLNALPGSSQRVRAARLRQAIAFAQLMHKLALFMWELAHPLLKIFIEHIRSEALMRIGHLDYLPAFLYSSRSCLSVR